MGCTQIDVCSIVLRYVILDGNSVQDTLVSDESLWFTTLVRSVKARSNQDQNVAVAYSC